MSNEGKKQYVHAEAVQSQYFSVRISPAMSRFIKSRTDALGYNTMKGYFMQLLKLDGYEK